MVVCWVWGRRRFGPDSLIFLVLYFTTIGGILNGQDCVILAVIAVIAVTAYTQAERERELRSGMVMSLALIKFHLLILLLFAMLLRRRTKMMLGFAIGAAGLALLSPLLGGIVGVESYVALLTNKDLERLSPSPGRMTNIHASFGVENLGLTIVGVVLVLALVMVAVGSAPLWRWMAAALAGSLLIVPHVYGYDGGLMLPFLLLTVFKSKDTYSRIIATTFLTPLPFFPLMIGSPCHIGCGNRRFRAASICQRFS